jgi:ABC-type Mn2+/Zn2+ transport system ATPase subunit
VLDVRSVCVVNRLAPTTFFVDKYDAILITGSNGTGKSTLLDCITGNLKPSSGQISTPGDAMMAYLPQVPPRPFPYNVREYLAIGTETSSLRASMDSLGISQFLDKDITTLSAGQWQRVAITKVIESNSSIIVLDEPDAPLDDQWSASLATIIDKEVSTGRVIVLTLHREEIRKSWKFQHLNLTLKIGS